MSRIALSAVIGVAALASCAPAAQIQGAVALIPPDCSAGRDAPQLAEGLLDIGLTPVEANEYRAAFIVDIDDATVTWDTVEVWLSTDVDQPDQPALQNVGTPNGPLVARRTGIGATSTQPVVIAPILTREDAAALQDEAVVREALIAGTASGNPADNRFRVIAHTRLLGTTAAGAAVSSQEFPFPVEVCAGCLVACQPGQEIVATGCAVGQDFPASCI